MFMNMKTKHQPIPYRRQFLKRKQITLTLFFFLGLRIRNTYPEQITRPTATAANARKYIQSTYRRRQFILIIMITHSIMFVTHHSLVKENDENEIGMNGSQTFSWQAKIRIITAHMSDVSKDRFSIVDPLICKRHPNFNKRDSQRNKSQNTSQILFFSYFATEHLCLRSRLTITRL